MRYGRLSWHLLRTDFTRAKPILDDFKCRTMRTRYFIDGHASIRQKHFSSLLNLHVSGGRWWASRFIFLLHTFRIIFNFSTHSYTLLYDKMLSLYWKPVMNFSPGQTLYQRNRMTDLCSALLHTASEAAVFPHVTTRVRNHKSTIFRHANVKVY